MTDSHEFPRLTFDSQTGRAEHQELTEAQYVTLVATARCPVVIAATKDCPATRCREALLIDVSRFTRDGGRDGFFNLEGDWRCADDHGPADYLASPPD